MNVVALLTVLSIAGIISILSGAYIGLRTSSSASTKQEIKTATGSVSQAKIWKDAKEWASRTGKDENRTAVEKLLEESGNPKGWSVSDFAAARVAYGALVGVVILLLCLLVGFVLGFTPLIFLSVLLAPLGYLFGFTHPKRTLVNESEQRKADVLRQLPSLLISVALGVETGLSPERAMLRAAEESERGTLKGEILLIGKEIESGKSFAASMNTLRKRVPGQVVDEFVQKMIDATQSGGNASGGLFDLADTIQAQRMAAIEQMAALAPMKLLAGAGVPVLFAFLIEIGYPLFNSLSGAMSGGAY